MKVLLLGAMVFFATSIVAGQNVANAKNVAAAKAVAASKNVKAVAGQAASQMFKACENKTDGAACSYDINGKKVDGKCFSQQHPVTKKNEVVCRPGV